MYGLTIFSINSLLGIWYHVKSNEETIQKEFFYIKNTQFLFKVLHAVTKIIPLQTIINK